MMSDDVRQEMMTDIALASFQWWDHVQKAHRYRIAAEAEAENTRRDNDEYEWLVREANEWGSMANHWRDKMDANLTRYLLASCYSPN